MGCPTIAAATCSCSSCIAQLPQLLICNSPTYPQPSLRIEVQRSDEAPQRKLAHKHSKCFAVNFVATSMGEEYDPDGFSLRISPGLFHVLSGRASEPGPVEARTPREAALIEAVRKEGRRERAAMLREINETQLKESHGRKQSQQLALKESAEKLRSKLASLHFPTGSSTELPCSSFRDAITLCYKVNGKKNPLACMGEVEAFTDCAKQLTRASVE